MNTHASDGCTAALAQEAGRRGNYNMAAFTYDRDQLRKEVSELLIHDRCVAKIDFAMEAGTGPRRSPIQINGLGFQRIGALIRSGQILIESDRDNGRLRYGCRHKRKTALGRYFGRGNGRSIIVLHSDSIIWSTNSDCSPVPAGASKYSVTPNTEFCNTTGNALKRTATFAMTPEYVSVLVHECTHALIDLYRVPTWSARDEAAASLAEVLYLHHRGKLNTLVEDGLAGAMILTSRKVAEEHGLFQNKKVTLDRKALRPLLRELYRDYPLMSLIARTDGIALDVN